ncbi:MAG: hypothetical protein Q9163_003260 [Psora crenata]
MDVSSLVISVISLSFKVASTLYSYGKEVKGARRDIQSLSNELFGLIGVLEHLKLREEQCITEADAKSLESAHSPETLRSSNLTAQREADWASERSDEANVHSVLNQTLEFLHELLESLVEPKRRFKAKLHLLTWPLRASEMQKHLERLERVKTYFVLFLVTDEVDQSRKAAKELMALRTVIQNTAQAQEITESRNKRVEIVDWLSPVDPSLIRKSIAKSRTPGTGAWFIYGHAFQFWSGNASASSITYWLNGITGAGKSTLMTAAVEELISKPNMHGHLAYFYCSFNNDQSLHTRNILGSILAQTCGITDPIYGDIESMYVSSSTESMGKPGRLEVDVLTDLITKRARDKGGIYILIDGINECSKPEELLYALKAISTSASGVRIFLSSINEKGIEQHLQGMPGLRVETLRPDDIREDIGLSVEATIQSHPRLKQLPPNLKHDIAKALAKGAEGMFRWVQCQLDLLSRLRTPGAVRKALSSLPPTLDKAYEEMLLRIDGEEDVHLTKEILQILAFCRRPLTLQEISTMLQITPGMPYLDEGKYLAHPKDILGICGGFLDYHESTGLITLAHHSAKTYLTSNLQGKVSCFRIDEVEAHRAIATYCLTYLSFDSFSHDPDFLPRAAPGLYKDFCFLDYAAQQWPLHIRELCEIGEPLWSILRSFLLSSEHGRHNFITWVQLLLPDSRNSKSTPPLYYASSFGLTTVVRYLLEMGADVEARGGRGGATPINIAAFRGHLEIVKLLYEHGADPLKGDAGSMCDAICWARGRGHWRVVEYFREQGYHIGPAPYRSVE